jgi:hypothetical protein
MALSLHHGIFYTGDFVFGSTLATKFHTFLFASITCTQTNNKYSNRQSMNNTKLDGIMLAAVI